LQEQGMVVGENDPHTHGFPFCRSAAFRASPPASLAII
jgi:hypothetical protein